MTEADTETLFRKFTYRQTDTYRETYTQRDILNNSSSCVVEMCIDSMYQTNVYIYINPIVILPGTSQMTSFQSLF